MCASAAGRRAGGEPSARVAPSGGMHPPEADLRLERASEPSCLRGWALLPNLTSSGAAPNAAQIPPRPNA
eukprot:352366-Chlamydomonas_euryale.AAC.2